MVGRRQVDSQCGCVARSLRGAWPNPGIDYVSAARATHAPMFGNRRCVVILSRQALLSPCAVRRRIAVVPTGRCVILRRQPKDRGPPGRGASLSGRPRFLAALGMTHPSLRSRCDAPLGSIRQLPQHPRHRSTREELARHGSPCLAPRAIRVHRRAIRPS
jgi:hypothetical protein